MKNMRNISTRRTVAQKNATKSNPPEKTTDLLPIKQVYEDVLAPFKCETKGDLIGILIELLKIGVIEITDSDSGKTIT